MYTVYKHNSQIYPQAALIQTGRLWVGEACAKAYAKHWRKFGILISTWWKILKMILMVNKKGGEICIVSATIHITTKNLFGWVARLITG